MTDVIVQLGHCFRKTGATGTSGLYGGRRRTEQEFASKVGYRMVEHLNAAGITAKAVLADDPIPASKVFVALHQDGSENHAARGASVGYPSTGRGRELGQTWKAMYQLAGWPSGFRPDNYTAALRGYYGFRRSTAPTRLLIEHGFATNPSDQAWMWQRWAQIAQVNAEAVAHHLGRRPTLELGEAPMDQINDTNRKRLFTVWVHNGTTHVREHSSYIASAGRAMPNVSYVIDEQVAAGRMVRVSD